MNIEKIGLKKLKIYRKSHELAIKIHRMTLLLPKFETYEEGSQIRRSSKSISSNIVEGYALRKYKKTYLRFLYYAYASCLETIEHLELLFETKSFKDIAEYNKLKYEYSALVKMLFSFMDAVERRYKPPFYIDKTG